VKADHLRLGGIIFAAGLLKKTLFADNLAPIADAAFNHPAGLDTASAWLGTLAFAFQIYFDFSAYSEMAIGLALLFGVQLPRNFLYPYISRSPSEFWRRWHITLSTWLRDYLYIALGGNRGSGLRTAFNLMATMVLGGLWHGANWTFVAWGALHGAALVAHRLLKAGFERAGVRPGSSASQMISRCGWPLTSLTVLVSWVFFRAPDFADAATMLGAMAGVHGPTAPRLDFRLYEVAIVAAAALLVALEPLVMGWCERHGIGGWWRVPFVLRGAAYAAMVLAIVAFGGTTQKFIYFDF
jgi:alginate O-acetyltransferase complex protein AlgI